MSLLEAAAEPVRIQRDGQEYLVSALSLGDQAEIQRWAEQRVWDELKRRLADIEDVEVKKLLKHRLATISKAEITREADSYIVGSESNIKFMHLMLRHEQPDITEEQCAELMTTAEFNEIYAEVHHLKQLDKITELEQEFFGAILPDIIVKVKAGDAADIPGRLTRFHERYQKELELDRPPEA